MRKSSLELLWRLLSAVNSLLKLLTAGSSMLIVLFRSWVTLECLLFLHEDFLDAFFDEVVDLKFNFRDFFQIAD